MKLMSTETPEGGNGWCPKRPASKGSLRRKAVYIGIFLVLMTGLSIGFLASGTLFGVIEPHVTEYNVEQIPLNEYQEDWITSFEGSSIRGGRIYFDQQMNCYADASDALSFAIEQNGTVLTLTETYSQGDGGDSLYPYYISGTIEGLQSGQYTIRVVYIDEYADTIETVYESTVVVQQFND